MRHYTVMAMRKCIADEITTHICRHYTHEVFVVLGATISINSGLL